MPPKILSKSQRKKLPKQLSKKPKTVEEAKQMALEKFGVYSWSPDGYHHYAYHRDLAVKDAIAKFNKKEEKKARR